jgi:tRNA pseudouridine13 synthase
MTPLPYAYGGPPLRAVLRATPEDFVVDEDLGFDPDGAGEHLLVRVEKRGANTEWVARELARFAGIGGDSVSFAGMKDRHAIARQTFSLHLPGRDAPDWSQLQHAEFRVLSSTRHSRKLRRGSLRGNSFQITLREISGDRDAANRCIESIAREGVPNYFGEQRFGRGGQNLERARQVFAGRRVRRHELGVSLSAARAQVFNAVLARRVEAGNWNSALDGEVWMLAGSHSIFGPEPISPELIERQRTGDIVATGPMWGVGALRSTGEVNAIENDVAAQFSDFAAGLEKFDLRQERRALVLLASQFSSEWIDESSLQLRFWLNSGSYATGLIREICQWKGDATADME